MDPDLTDLDDVRDYLRIVEILDSIPRRNRTPIGKKIFEKAELAAEEGRPRYLVSGALGAKARVLFLFHPGDRDERRELLHFLTTLLHARFVHLAADADSCVTLGVATEPYPTSGRSHDYQLAEGDLWEESPEFKRQTAESYALHFPSDPV